MTGIIGVTIWVIGVISILSKGSNGNLNRAPQECSRNIIEHKDPGRYTTIIFLLYSWASLFGIPSKVPSYLLSPPDPPSRARH